MTLADYEKLKTRAADARTAADRAAGAAAQLRERLKTEFGCDGLRTAKRKLRELEKAAAGLNTAFETAARAFEKEYPDDRA